VPWEAVASEFERATRVDPRSARAWNNLGIAWARLGRTGEARHAYLRVRRLDGELSSPERKLRVLRTRQGDGSEVSVEEYAGPDP